MTATVTLKNARVGHEIANSCSTRVRGGMDGLW
jgi:hypothetical protein